MTDIELVSASECYIVTEVSEPVPSSSKSSVPLSPREIEIVQLLAEGRTNKQVAAELGISVRTAESHRRHIMQKTRVRSLVQLIYYALEQGIVTRR
ncbi:MAG TPA: LuxR C-terminal-related transcriptional regulator [Candidatus Acidoferrales bacterium]|nr:LuxR C-terminal-related transcriptional regulator [Candidatus Acidoferrales bacterium]